MVGEHSDALFTYRAPATFNAISVKNVIKVCDQHTKELNEALHEMTEKEQNSLAEVFIKELEQQWPREYSEIQIRDVVKAVREKIRKHLQRVYIVGYAIGKKWIEREQAYHFYLCLGDNLACDIKSNFPTSKSRGAAFASAFAAVAIRGHLATARTIKTASESS